MKWTTVLLLVLGFSGRAQDYPQDAYTFEQVFKEHMRCTPDSMTAHWYDEYRLIVDSSDARFTRLIGLKNKWSKDTDWQIERVTKDTQLMLLQRDLSQNLYRLLLIMMINRYQWQPGLFKYYPAH